MKKIWGFFRLSLSSSLALAATILLGASLVGFTELRGYLADQCSQLRLLYLLAIGLMLVPMFVFRSYVGIAIATLAALVNLSQIMPFYFSQEAKAQSKPERELKIVAINLWGRHNSSYNKVSKYVRKTNPDLLCLSEVNKAWLEKLKEELPEYKYSFDEGFSGGAAIFSKIPIEQTITWQLGVRRYGVRGKFNFAGKDILLISAHPPAPYRRSLWKLRNQEFDRLASELSSMDTPAVLIGDLNTTPWSKYFKEMVNKGNLRDSELGNGIQPSWNGVLPIFPLVPIDHCLVSKNLFVVTRSVGPYVGSDHLPVCVKLQVAESKDGSS